MVESLTINNQPKARPFTGYSLFAQEPGDSASHLTDRSTLGETKATKIQLTRWLQEAYKINQARCVTSHTPILYAAGCGCDCSTGRFAPARKNCRCNSASSHRMCVPFSFRLGISNPQRTRPTLSPQRNQPRLALVLRLCRVDDII